MLLTFIGAIAVAVLAACVAFVIYRVTGINARWIIPAAAGAGMFGFTFWNDYTWFSRNVDGLPETVVVTDSFEHRHVIQPWTLVVPMINRFRAVDTASIRAHPERPAVRGAVVFLAQRYQPTFVTRQVFDCAAGRRADAEVGPFDEAGLPVESAWASVPAGDPLLEAVCGASV
jgi:hypothetical protein